MKVMAEMSGKDGKVKIGVDEVAEFATSDGYKNIISEIVYDAINAYKELKDDGKHD